MPRHPACTAEIKLLDSINIGMQSATRTTSGRSLVFVSIPSQSYTPSLFTIFTSDECV